MTVLDDRARSWVAAELGSQVESVSVLTGGVASQMLAVRSVTGGQAVLRRMTVEPWRSFAQGLLRREFEVQAMLQEEPLPTPTPIAVDLDGAESGEPSLLMSRLPGRVDFVRDDDGHLSSLAELLVRLHRFRPPEDSWPRDFQSWAAPGVPSYLPPPRLLPGQRALGGRDDHRARRLGGDVERAS
jgi:aminoglycoside phosphotransferase (APT) family kinase protein